MVEEEADLQPGPQHEACRECRRYKESQIPFIGITPATNASKIEAHRPGTHYDILEVGESPGAVENRVGRNFVGPSGAFLTAKEQKAGLRPGNTIARVNTVRCYAEHKPTREEMILCRPFLFDAIKETTPELIISFGAYALRSLTNLSNVTKRLGIPIHKDGLVIVPNIHPAFVLRDRRNEEAFVNTFTQIADVLRRLRGEDSKIEQLRKRYHVPMTDPEFDWWVEFLCHFTLLAHDTEFCPLDVLSPRLTCLGMSFSWGEKTGVFFPLDHPESPFRNQPHRKEQLRVLIENIPLIEHNAEVDTVVDIRCLGADPRKIRVFWDTMRGSIAAHGKNGLHRLKGRAYVDADTGGYDEELEKYKREHPEVEEYDQIPLHILSNPYAAGDTDTTWQSCQRQIPKIEKMGQKYFYENIFLPGFQLNWIMQKNGICLDWDEWNWRYEYWRKRKVEVYEKVLSNGLIKAFAIEHERATGKRFSLKSRPQMLMLWDLLELPLSTRKTDLGDPSLDQYSLLEIQPELEGHPHRVLPDTLLEMGEIDKTLGTYLEGFADDLRDDGRIHPRFHNFTDSGRRGSANPNVQNIPVKNPKIPSYEGCAGPTDPWNFRMLLRAAPGKVFVVPDYGQLEFRLAACYCKDENMIQACRESDPHRLTKDRLGIDRKPAKTTNFQLIYGCAWPRLQSEIRKATGLDWDQDTCEGVIREFKEIYPRLFPYIDHVHEEMAEKLYVTTPVGHVRLFPHIKSDDHKIVERAQREGWNHKCQSLGHDLLSLAMDKVQKFIWDNELPDWWMVNDTHDGFILEVPEDDARKAAELSKGLMEAQGSILGDWLQVPLVAEVAVGTHFGNLTELEDL